MNRDAYPSRDATPEADLIAQYPPGTTFMVHPSITVAEIREQQLTRAIRLVESDRPAHHHPRRGTEGER